MEPFLGAGAMFLGLEPTHAIVNDMNPWVIMMWHLCTHHIKYVENKSQKLYEVLDNKDKSAEYFTKTLKRFNNVRQKYEKEIPATFMSTCSTCHCTRGLIDVAFDMYYLVRASFGAHVIFHDDGKIRANFGNLPLTTLFNKNYVSVHNYLKKNNIVFTCTTYQNVLKMISGKENGVKTFIYLDPPYHSDDRVNKGYYADNVFGDDKQIELERWMKTLSAQGNLVMQSNSYTPFIKRLYKEYSCRTFDIQRSFANHTKGASHKKNDECVIMNY